MENAIEKVTMRQSFYYDLFLHSPLLMYMCDMEGIVTSYNLSAQKFLGNTAKQAPLLYDAFLNIHTENGKKMPKGQHPITLTLTQGEQVEKDVYVPIPDSVEYRIMRCISSPMRNSEGNQTGASVCFIDISKQKKQEEKQAIFTALVRSSSDAIISKNLKGIITSWNDAAEKIFDFKASEIIGQSIYNLIPERLKNEERKIIDQIKRGKRVEHFHTYRKMKSGKEIPISLTVSPIINTQGKIIGASKIARDISDQIEKEIKVQEYAERLEILNSLGKTISGKMEIASIMRTVIQSTTKSVEADIGILFYQNSEKKIGPLHRVKTVGLPRNFFLESDLEDNSSGPYPFSLNKKSYLIEDWDQVSKGYSNTGLQKIREKISFKSLLSVPIISKKAVIGRIYFVSKKANNFTQDDLYTITAIASQVSISFTNSELFGEVLELNHKKDEFIALASHELRTPLATLKGYLQILQGRESDTLKTRFIDKSLTQADRLTVLVDDLFDISRIEAGKLQLEYEYFDVITLIGEIIETLSYSNRSNDIILHVGENVKEIEADRQRLEQVLVNLLTNAIKYSPAGEPIQIYLEYDPNNLTVKIEDKGVGVSEENATKIFDRFYRVENSNHIAGLGLGLYLTKEIINRHHGNIFVTANKDKGSTFIFFIPIQKPKNNN